MNSLVEFLAYTKGIEYLLAVAFLFAFLGLWFWLHYRGKGLARKVVPFFVVTLMLAALALSCIVEENEIPPISLEISQPLELTPVLTEMYGPAHFDHEKHKVIVESCTTCHHYSSEGGPNCSDCHSDPFTSGKLDMPGLARVYHLRCISCHMEEQLGPIECTECHHKAEIPPLSIQHPLTGRGACLSCHDDGLFGVPQIPPDHDYVTNGMCQLCHIPVIAEEALAIRPLPHAIGGLENCLLCHGEGISGATKVPSDHAGRTNETCTACHES